MKPKIIRITTVALSLDYLLKGQLAFLNTGFEVVAVSGKDSHLKNVALREGVRVVNISMQRAINPIKDLISLWKLYHLFRKEKPQIVHSITPKAGLLSMIAARFSGIPIRIHTFTGLIFPSKTGIMQKILIGTDRLLCTCATHVYPEGEGVKKDLINYKITNKPLKILANGNVNGIDTSFFSPSNFSESENVRLKKQLGVNKNDFVFIFVGRLVSDKGINELVTAFDKLCNTKFKNKTPKLLLVGPFESDLDPLHSHSLTTIQQNPNIISVGLQQDVRPYFTISDVLIFPSYREGFPNVVIQAGSMSLPSIVTNINGCNEIIIAGENGWIIPVKDEVAILNAMQNCLMNTIELNNLSKNTRNLIVSRYEQKVVWEALLKEYQLLAYEFENK
jgi:glycosyltransferase involved in cell wall biosynthesis